MTTKYISYTQTENLLKSWVTIQGIKESLGAEHQAIEASAQVDDSNGYISTKALGNKGSSGMPHAIGGKSDSTGNIAENYKQMMDRDYMDALNRINGEMVHVTLADDKLNIAFRRLTSIQQKILELFYLENKTWKEALEELRKEGHFINKQNAQQYRRKAVERVQSISKITVEMYEFVMKLVEG